MFYTFNFSRWLIYFFRSFRCQPGEHVRLSIRKWDFPAMQTILIKKTRCRYIRWEGTAAAATVSCAAAIYCVTLSVMMSTDFIIIFYTRLDRRGNGKNTCREMFLSCLIICPTTAEDYDGCRKNQHSRLFTKLLLFLLKSKQTNTHTLPLPSSSLAASQWAHKWLLFFICKYMRIQNTNQSRRSKRVWRQCKVDGMSS